MDGDVEAKQKYLCSEILLKGYDPDDFTAWIDTNKPKGRHSFIKDVIWRDGLWMNSNQWYLNTKRVILLWEFQIFVCQDHLKRTLLLLYLTKRNILRFIREVFR